MAMTSSTFDAKTALAAARSADTLPEGWSKFSVVRGLVLTRVIMALAGAAVALGFVAFILWAETIPVFQIAGSIVFAVIALGLLVIGVQGMLILRRLSDYFFLITPQGFAQVKGGVVMALPLTELTKVKLVRGIFTVSLLVTRRSGDPIKMTGLRDYGQPMRLTQQLIAACSALYPDATAKVG